MGNLAGDWPEGNLCAELIHNQNKKWSMEQLF